MPEPEPARIRAETSDIAKNRPKIPAGRRSRAQHLDRDFDNREGGVLLAAGLRSVNRTQSEIGRQTDRRDGDRQFGSAVVEQRRQQKAEHQNG